jgi:hypothetical protein
VRCLQILEPCERLPTVGRAGLVPILLALRLSKVMLRGATFDAMRYDACEIFQASFLQQSPIMPPLFDLALTLCRWDIEIDSLFRFGVKSGCDGTVGNRISEGNTCDPMGTG